MSHVLLSDDDGAAWRLSHSFFANTGEGSVAETGSSGSLVFVARRIGATHCSDPVVGHCAATMVSSDGCDTWTDRIDVGALPGTTSPHVHKEHSCMHACEAVLITFSSCSCITI